MKKVKNNKFGFEKFEMAKLNNPKMIQAGDSSAICTTTDNNPDTSRGCGGPQVDPPPTATKIADYSN